MMVTPTKQPTYRRIQESLRERVARGDWQQGQALPSRRALAEEFGTTRITVEKAVRELEREGLLQSIHGRGTFVYRAAPGAPVVGVQKESFTIGILQGHTVRYAEPVPLFRDHFFFGSLFQGICEMVDEHRSSLFVVRVGDRSYSEVAQDRSADGWIVVAPTLEDANELHEWQRKDIPFITIANSSAMPYNESPIPFVESANRDGVRLALDHLYSLGHRRIAHVNLGTSDGDCYVRAEGFLAAMSELNLPLSPDHLITYPLHAPHYLRLMLDAWVERMRLRNNFPTAILASDYSAVFEVVQNLTTAGLRIPEDVSLIAFDDPLSAAHLTPPLTTVRQPLFEIGQRAASRLLNHLSERRASPDVPMLRDGEFMPVSLVVRASTCPPRPEGRTTQGASQ